MKFLRGLVLALLFLPLITGYTLAETISWIAPSTYTDNTAISSADKARITYYLRGWKAGSPAAKTYFGEKRQGGTSWTDNIMVRMNEWGVTNSVPGWVAIKPWDNVLVTMSAAISWTDNTGAVREFDGPEVTPPYAWRIPGPAAFAALSANPTVITLGQCSTLTWITTDAVSASINQGIGFVALSGNRQVCPTVATTYIITATNPGGPVTSSAIVAVTVPPPPTPSCNAPMGLTIQ